MRVIQVVVVRAGPLSPSVRVRVIVGVAVGAAERQEWKSALELVRLTGLVDAEYSDARFPRKLVDAAELDQMAAVAAEITIFEIPQLASGTVGDVRRADEDRRVIGDRKSTRLNSSHEWISRM